MTRIEDTPGGRLAVARLADAGGSIAAAIETLGLDVEISDFLDYTEKPSYALVAQLRSEANLDPADRDIGRSARPDRGDRGCGIPRRRRDRESRSMSDPRVIFRFVLGGQVDAPRRWNWPVDGRDGIDAFREILTRAGIEFDEDTDQAGETAEKVSIEVALEMLEIIDDYDAGNGPEQCVHTYRQGPAGMMIGAHWSLEKVKAEIAERGIELSGPVAAGMGHRLVLKDETGVVFIATKKEQPAG